MKTIRTLFAALLLVLIATTAHANLRVASFNAKHLGYSNHKDMAELAAVISRFDLVAIEEVMDPAAVKRLASRLSSVTDSPWQSVTSEAIGRGSYRESYSFVWRKSTVDYQGGATVYLDPGDVFARQPLSAVFADRDDGQRFVYAAVHIIYGDGRSDRTPEIRALADYWVWLEDNFHAPVVLAGDFNTEPDDPAWRALGHDAQPLIRRGATTLSSHDNQYAHLYDNIWVRPGQLDITSSGIARYPDWLGITHRDARRHVSDHAPVYFTLGAVRVDTGLLPQAKTNSNRSKHAALGAGCIDLNGASARELEKLEHVGPARAQAIIAHRPYSAVRDLRSVYGLGPSRVSDIRQSGQVCAL